MSKYYGPFLAILAIAVATAMEIDGEIQRHKIAVREEVRKHKWDRFDYCMEQSELCLKTNGIAASQRWIDLMDAELAKNK